MAASLAGQPVQAPTLPTTGTKRHRCSDQEEEPSATVQELADARAARASVEFERTIQRERGMKRPPRPLGHPALPDVTAAAVARVKGVQRHAGTRQSILAELMGLYPAVPFRVIVRAYSLAQSLTTHRQPGRPVQADQSRRIDPSQWRAPAHVAIR